LGDGTTLERHLPVPVQGLSGVYDASAPCHEFQLYMEFPFY